MCSPTERYQINLSKRAVGSPEILISLYTQFVVAPSGGFRNLERGVQLASFPGPARSSLAVRNSRRGPGLVHHVMSATVVFLRHQITMFAVLPIYMCNGVSS